MDSFTIRFKDNENNLIKTVIQASGRLEAVAQFRDSYPTNLLYYCINNKELETYGTSED